MPLPMQFFEGLQAHLQFWTPLFPSLMQEVAACHCLHSFFLLTSTPAVLDPTFPFIDAGGGCMPLPAQFF